MHGVIIDRGFTVFMSEYGFCVLSMQLSKPIMVNGSSPFLFLRVVS
jgi:hypothetical protein